MKVFTYLLALPALILPVLGAPATDNAVAAQPAKELSAAQNPTLAVQTLLASVKEKDAQINETMATVTKWSSSGDKSQACDAVSELLEEIIELVEGLVGELLGAITCKKGSNLALKKLVHELVQEISCTLKGVLSILGLNSILKPLVKSLLKEVLSLVKCLLCLVDGLLEDVKGLLSGILGGLVGNLLNSVLGLLGL